MGSPFDRHKSGESTASSRTNVSMNTPSDEKCIFTEPAAPIHEYGISEPEKSIPAIRAFFPVDTMRDTNFKIDIL